MRSTHARLLALALLTLVVGWPAPGATTAPARLPDPPTAAGTAAPAAAAPAAAPPSATTSSASRAQERSLRDGAQHTTRSEATVASRRDTGRSPMAPWWPATALVLTWVVVGSVVLRRPRPATVAVPAVVRPRGPPTVHLIPTTA